MTKISLYLSREEALNTSFYDKWYDDYIEGKSPGLCFPVNVGYY